MNRMMAEKVPQKYPKLVVQTVLQGLGVAGKQSNALLELALPKMRRPARTISRVSAVS
jgi:hypothetical protein